MSATLFVILSVVLGISLIILNKILNQSTRILSKSTDEITEWIRILSQIKSELPVNPAEKRKRFNKQSYLNMKDDIIE